ncbi:dTDP-4-dehydrorhamnose reductase [Candidatus Margulisiibacteriota bacterium]
MKIALIGHTGMLGTDLINTLSQSAHNIYCFNTQNIDISSTTSTQKALSDVPADIIINCAAYTKVDDCEKNQALAFSINAEGPKNLALVANNKNIPLIHFSTDYVYNGRKKTLYLETDPCNPINIYGQSKLEGELAIKKNCRKYYIFRLQWLYGKNGSHFIKTILELAKHKKELSIVSDQWGSPTWTKEVAKSVLSIFYKKVDFGIYHLANQGYTNWHDFAVFFLKELNINCKLYPVTSSKFPRPAERPKNSQLCINKFLALQQYQPNSWQEACKEFLEENETNEK